MKGTDMILVTIPWGVFHRVKDAGDSPVTDQPLDEVVLIMTKSLIDLPLTGGRTQSRLHPVVA